MKPKNGFSMVDLLIATLIMGVIIGATITVLNPTGQQGKARDAQRRADLNQYRVALEAYAVAHDGTYPRRTSRQYADSVLCPDLGSVFMTDCPSDPGHNPGEDFLPTDPSTRINYTYISNNPGCSAGTACATEFVLWVYLESGGIWEVCADGRQGLLTINPPASPSDTGGNCEVSL